MPGGAMILPVNSSTERTSTSCPDLRPSNTAETSSLKARMEASVAATRSEEHTSELQSLAYLVCRLLLEKKKKKKKYRMLKTTMIKTYICTILSSSSHLISMCSIQTLRCILFQQPSVNTLF